MKIAALCAILIVIAASAHGGQSGGLATPPADKTPYLLASTVLHTLSMAASARDSLAETGSSRGDPIADSLNAIVAQRGAVSRLRQAVALLQQFRGSRDEPIRKGAEDLANIYETLGDRLLAGVVIWEKLAKTKTTEDIAALVPESGMNAADIQDAWRLLPVGIASVSHALIDSERLTDGRISRLRLTRAERAQLNDEIKTLFPTVKAEEKGGQVVDVSVNLFRGFLNQWWKSSDDK